MSLETNKKPHCKQATLAYKNFWSTCTDAFIFGVDTKFSLPIDRLVSAPAHLNVRVSEKTIVDGMIHYLLHLPDQSTRQTLCVMPKGHDEKLDSWESVKDGEFYIINGQHTLEASKVMQSMDLDEDMLSEFRKWNCFIVWTRDKETL